MSANGTGGASHYRADIDGLRAISVLFVLFYHFDVPGFYGGFLGVDVFFTISGYLITKQLLDEWNREHHISLKKFYLRRFRRLFPALLATVFGSVIAASLLIPPQIFVNFAESVFASLTGTSNIYFWLQSGYFDDASLLKPLLHTWSLSVEEQFYLFWPITLIILARYFQFISLKTAFLGLFAMALFLSVFFDERVSATFYLTPFRVYEFMLGALCVPFAALSSAIAPRLREGAAIVALFCLFSSFWLIDSSARIPSYLCLVPCGSVAIIILLNANLVGKWLSLSPVNYIGRISYSLYLVHWPVGVFYKFADMDIIAENTRFLLSEAVLLTIASIGLASVMYRWIEQPFRNVSNGKYDISWRKTVIGFLTVILPMMMAMADVVRSGGWFWRIPEKNRQIVQTLMHRDNHSQSACFHRVDDLGDLFGQERFSNCATSHEKTVMVVGDSHAIDLFNSFAALLGNPDSDIFVADKVHLAGVSRGGCGFVSRSRDTCAFKKLPEFIAQEDIKVDAVIFTFYGADILAFETRAEQRSEIEELMQYLSRLENEGVEVLLLGPLEPLSQNPKAVNYLKPDVLERISFQVVGTFRQLDTDLQDASERHGIKFVSKQKLVAFDPTSELTGDFGITYSDTDHWTAVGEVLFGERLLQSAELQILFGLSRPVVNSD